ncbi:hypothetical protein PAQ31011_04017 [Pandoraea aquatica]|uniref:Uncharacterized protein n=1 Tax=Pandoraea aquatica TaxID=2508290 RepID=A0A5E4XNF8_9BURK|nr:DUF4865 family protein [Pandoraea aquatica]VVE37840.1 hypothetical protein PAQ31011_04017 [Pandoraea aquatica]
MLTAHYLHRLPADYDLNAIRARGKTRGALWDAAIAYEVVHLSSPLLHTLSEGRSS